METTEKNSVYFSRRVRMEITREGVIPVKVWWCYNCTFEEVSNEQPHHYCESED